MYDAVHFKQIMAQDFVWGCKTVSSVQLILQPVLDTADLLEWNTYIDLHEEQHLITSVIALNLMMYLRYEISS